MHCGLLSLFNICNTKACCRPLEIKIKRIYDANLTNRFWELGNILFTKCKTCKKKSGLKCCIFRNIPCHLLVNLSFYLKRE